MKEVILPSGAKLEMNLAPFADGKELYQAALEELKVLKVSDKEKIDVNLFKDLFCAGFASKRIEAALWKCFVKATYNGLRITQDTFEPETAREDYLTVCFEVAKENLHPFTKSLYAKYDQVLAMLKNLPA